jgi:hypothetical protein
LADEGRVFYRNADTHETSAGHDSDPGHLSHHEADDHTHQKRWDERFGQLLAVADAVHEVVFVYDRSHDGHPLPHEAVSRSFKAADALSVVPLRLEPMALRFMRSRPIVLRPSLARFNAAQVKEASERRPKVLIMHCCHFTWHCVSLFPFPVPP